MDTTPSSATGRRLRLLVAAAIAALACFALPASALAADSVSLTIEEQSRAEGR